MRFPWSKAPRYVSETAYQRSLSSQTSMSPKTLQQLYAHGVSPEMQLPLEYFFYTDTTEKARRLVEALVDLGYDPECGASASDERTILITGWSPALLMEEYAVVEWVTDMCQVGFEHDCEFDGWGTNVPSSASPDA